MNNAVIYARYSAGPRQTDQSIEGQITECKRFAEANNLNIVGIYADRHISGTSTEGRYEFLRMVDDAKKGRFDAVIVWKVDRFGRDRRDIAIYKHQLKAAGVTLHYAAESVPDGPEGIILESVLEGLAEYYSADLRQKVTRGMKESLKKGQYPGKLPYGYTKDKQKNVLIKEDEAKVVREIFRLCAERHSIAEIVRILTNKGIFMKNGSIYRILNNHHYTGKFEMMGMEINVEPIIAEEEWNLTRDFLKSPHRTDSRIRYALSGKCVCAECGSILTGTHGTSKSGKKFAYYHCQKKCLKPLPKDKYERIILEEVRGFCLTDELISKIIDRIMETQEEDSPNAEIKRLEAQISDYKKRIDNLLDAVENGLKMDSVASRIEDYESKISSCALELERQKIKKPTIPREFLQVWLESYRDGDLENKDFCKQLINAFIAGIVAYEDHSVVILNISGEKEDPQCSNISRFVNLTKQYSNTEGLSLTLPYALLWVRVTTMK